MNPFFDPSRVPPIYKVRASGDCMEPLIPEGCTFFVCDDEPQIGDLACVFFREGIFSEGGNMKGKILAGMTDDSVTLSQINPPETITFNRRAILSMHRVYAVELPDGLCTIGALLRAFGGVESPFAVLKKEPG
ncbi:MAG: hypothetical protein E5V61_04725 [Mesorhizobium sp.]|nr:MAG: hypothetical protein E5V61_04725 [Mesorhizobium sp.]